MGVFCAEGLVLWDGGLEVGNRVALVVVLETHHLSADIVDLRVEIKVVDIHAKRQLRCVVFETDIRFLL